MIYNFPAGNDGGPSFLLEGSDGKIYGSTLGALGQGGSSELFSVTKSGEFTLLHTMSITADGACGCSMVQADDGMIYGTATGGGITNGGTIFALDVGLPKPAPRPQIFNPKSGAPGTKVLIWGAQLLTPSVTFNGVPAAEVTSSGPNYVWATVPAGASTGPITVTTPGGSVTTQASFTVE